MKVGKHINALERLWNLKVFRPASAIEARKRGLITNDQYECAMQYVTPVPSIGIDVLVYPKDLRAYMNRKITRQTFIKRLKLFKPKTIKIKPLKKTNMKSSNLGKDPIQTMANYERAVDDLKSLLKTPSKLSPPVFCMKHGISSNVFRALLRMNVIRKMGSGRSIQFHWVGNSIMDTKTLTLKMCEVVREIYAESRKNKGKRKASKKSETKEAKGIQALYEDALSGDVSFQRIGEYVSDMSQWENAVSLGIFSVDDWKIVANKELKHLLLTRDKPTAVKYSKNTLRTYAQCIKQIVSRSYNDTGVGSIKIVDAKKICSSVGYTPLKIAVKHKILHAVDDRYVLIDKSLSAINRMIDDIFDLQGSRPATPEHSESRLIAEEISSTADAKELAKMWTELGDYKMAISVLKKITSCVLLLFVLALSSCKGDSRPNNIRFMRTEIAVVNGDHDYFVKMVGTDSLFVNVVTDADFGGGFWATNNFSYMFYTKGHNFNSIAWDTVGKHSERVTVIQK